MPEGMLPATQPPPGRERSRSWEAPTAALAALALLVAFALWGGLPAPDQTPAFLAGVAVLLGVLAGLGLLTWHLLFRPLPAGHKTPRAGTLPTAIRRGLALLLGIGSLNIMVGGFWDEVWHRQYGLPFGEDFFWRPHLLMYFGFLAVTVLGFASLYLLMKRGRGTLQQRFRAQPTLGLLVMMCGLLLYVLPADPIWHAIYGEDLTAWSIPHLLLAISFSTIMLLAATLHLSTLPPQTSRRWPSAQDALPLLMFASILLMNMQFLTTEWDQPGPLSPILQARPEWMLPVIIAASAALVGAMSNRALGRAGMATLVGLIALGVRVGLIAIFNVDIMRFTGWVMALPPLLAVDLWWALRLTRRGAPPDWTSAGAAAAVGMLLALPVLLALYPAVSIANLPAAAVVVLLAGLGGSWLGARLGAFLAAQRQPTAADAPGAARFPLASLGALAAALAFLLVFIGTAAPPV